MKLQMNNLFLALVLGSLIGALAMAADNNDDKCSKAAACRQGTECRIVRGEPMCQCKEGAVCTDEWKPVCGSDKRTYPNKCHLTSSACGDTKVVRVAHIGRCITPPAGRG